MSKLAGKIKLAFHICFYRPLVASVIYSKP